VLVCEVFDERMRKQDEREIGVCWLLLLWDDLVPKVLLYNSMCTKVIKAIRLHLYMYLHLRHCRSQLKERTSHSTTLHHFASDIYVAARGGKIRSRPRIGIDQMTHELYRPSPCQ
jgi:hypothetical protein